MEVLRENAKSINIFKCQDGFFEFKAYSIYFQGYFLYKYCVKLIIL